MISNVGFNEGFITLYVQDGTEKDMPVTVSENNTCSLAENNAKFIGILRGAHRNIGSVQVKGYAELQYSGSEPELGANSLVADGLGGVKAAEGGVNVVITEVDTILNTVKFIF